MKVPIPFGREMTGREEALWTELMGLNKQVRWWNPFSWKFRYRKKLRWAWRAVAIHQLNDDHARAIEAK